MRAIRAIPLLLYSYLATELLAPFFASFLIMNGVFALVKLVPFLNIVLELNVNFSDFLRLFSYLFPNIFIYSIPMSLMMGVILSFTRLASDREVLALKASGINIYQMIPPVLVVSLVVAFVTGHFSVNLIPKAELAMKMLMFQIAKERIEKGIQEEQFTEALGNLVIYVDAIDEKDGRWKNVWISDMREQVQPIITMAKYGDMKANINEMKITINLYEGSSHKPDGNRSQIVEFERYTLKIPIQIPSIIGGDNVTDYTPQTMTMAQLRQAAESAGEETVKGRDYLIFFHKRLTLPVGCFILALLGVPLGLQTGGGRKAVGIPLGLGFFVFYYILFTLGKIMAEDGHIPVSVAMWLPNLIFLSITLYLIRQTGAEQSAIPERIKNLLFFAITKIADLVQYSKWSKS